MNITLNLDTKPYEQTRNRISILVSTFNKFILANHQPNQQETQQIYKQWKTLENKQINKSPPISPNCRKGMDSPEKRNTANLKNLQGRLRDIARAGLIAMQKNNRELFRM